MRDRRCSTGTLRHDIAKRQTTFKYHDRLDACRRPQRRQEWTRGSHRFDVEQYSVGAGIKHQCVQQFAEPDVDATTQRGNSRKADLHLRGEVEHRRAHRARLRYQCQPARERSGRTERRVEPDVGAHDAERTRADQSDAAPLGNGQDIATPCTPYRRIVGIRKRHQYRSPDARLGVIKDAGNGRGRRRDHD